MVVDAGLVDEVEQASHGLLALSIRAMASVDQVSATQLRALLLLRDAAPVNLSEFADGLGIATSSASRLVDRLAAAGYLTRAVPERSRREVELTLNAAGRRLLARHDRARHAAFVELLGALEPAELAALLDGLRAVNRVAERQGTSAATHRPD